MPNGVRNWPDPCDPRSTAPSPDSGPCFCAEGNGELYPSPWKFRVSVTSTSPLYTVFVGDWFVTFDERVQPADS